MNGSPRSASRVDGVVELSGRRGIEPIGEIQQPGGIARHAERRAARSRPAARPRPTRPRSSALAARRRAACRACSRSSDSARPRSSAAASALRARSVARRQTIAVPTAKAMMPRMMPSSQQGAGSNAGHRSRPSAAPSGSRESGMEQATTRNSTSGHLDEGAALPPLVRMVPRSHAAAHGLASLNAATD